jgi:hypothetical protein
MTRWIGLALFLALLALGAIWSQQTICDDLQRHRTAESIGNHACREMMAETRP